MYHTHKRTHTHFKEYTKEKISNSFNPQILLTQYSEGEQILIFKFVIVQQCQGIGLIPLAVPLLLIACSKSKQELMLSYFL
jgi:hypothetical protein